MSKPYFCFAADYNYESVVYELKKVRDQVEANPSQPVEVQVEKSMRDDFKSRINHSLDSYREKYGATIIVS